MKGDKLREEADKLLLHQIGHLHTKKEAEILEQYNSDTIPYDRAELDRRLREVVVEGKRRGKRAALMGKIRRQLRVAAVAVVLLAMIFSGLYLTVEAFRVSVRNLFVGEQETYLDFGLEYDAAEIKAAGFVFIPSWVPEGYKLDNLLALEMSRELVYTNMEGETLVYRETPGSRNFSADAETPEHGAILVGGLYEGYLSSKEGMTTLFWQRDGIRLSLFGPLDQETMLQIAQAVEQLN